MVSEGSNNSHRPCGGTVRLPSDGERGGGDGVIAVEKTILDCPDNAASEKELREYLGDTWNGYAFKLRFENAQERFYLVEND